MIRFILTTILTLAFFTTPNSLKATPIKQAVLIKDVQHNILTPNGKVIGFVKIPSGSTVIVENSNSSSEEILIHREGESAFKAPKDCVSNATIVAAETPTPTPTLPPTTITQTQNLISNITSTTTATIKTIEEVKKEITNLTTIGVTKTDDKNDLLKKDLLKNYYGTTKPQNI